MNITIKISGTEVPSKKQTRPKPVPLKDKIEHAIDCIACDVNKKKAIEFLQDVQVYLDGLDKQTEEQQHLLELVQANIAKYGNKLLPNKQNK